MVIGVSMLLDALVISLCVVLYFCMCMNHHKYHIHIVVSSFRLQSLYYLFCIFCRTHYFYLCVLLYMFCNSLESYFCFAHNILFSVPLRFWPV